MEYPLMSWDLKTKKDRLMGYYGYLAEKESKKPFYRAFVSVAFVSILFMLLIQFTTVFINYKTAEIEFARANGHKPVHINK